jgi:hypothetical protein
MTNGELQQRQADLDARLTEITPYVEAIKANPKLIDAVQQQTRPSAPQTIQPEDDAEAIDWAQDNGLITAQGELDVARARRQLNRLDAIAEKKAQAVVAPFRQNDAQRATEQNREAARRVTLPGGSRLASDESINEAYGMLRDAPELTANPQVAALMPLLAAGLDVAKGRRLPQGGRVDMPDPLYTEPAGGSRRVAAIPTETSRILAKVGVSEKEFSSAKAMTSRGVELE